MNSTYGIIQLSTIFISRALRTPVQPTPLINPLDFSKFALLKLRISNLSSHLFYFDLFNLIKTVIQDPKLTNEPPFPRIFTLLN